MTVTRTFGRAACLLVVALAIAGCGSGGSTKTATKTTDTTSPVVTAAKTQFCEKAGLAVAQFQGAVTGLAGAFGNPAQVQQATQGFTTAANTMIDALTSAPSPISADASAMADGIREELAASQAGTQGIQFPQDKQDAGNRVEQYMQTSCGIQSAIVPD